MKKFLLLILALLGMPILWALGQTFMQGIAFGVSRDNWLTSGCIGFLCGAGGMLLLYAWKRKSLDTLYVFAHEMTHALVGLCCFAKIHCIHIDKHSGYVQLSKENVLITLSPYCLPFYLLLSALLYGLLSLFFDEFLPFYLWAGLFGAATAFHILKTIDTLLGASQPDTRIYGRVFSYWFIACMNLLCGLIALCLTQLTGWQACYRMAQENVIAAYSTTLNVAYSFVAGL